MGGGQRFIFEVLVGQRKEELSIGWDEWLGDRQAECGRLLSVYNIRYFPTTWTSFFLFVVDGSWAV